MKCKSVPNLDYERRLWSKGYRCIAGLDEAGRGAWAGPLVAAAVVLPPDDLDKLSQLDGVNDSKQLSPARREALLECIREHALGVATGAVSPAEIDRIGIVPATCQAMALALDALKSDGHAQGGCSLATDYLLIDHLRLPALPLPQISLAKGDSKVLSIAAASIVAKVTRDRIMAGLDVEFPGYGFARHKGYGTPQHQEALAALGPSAAHRLSFAPLQRLQNRAAPDQGEDGAAASPVANVSSD